MISARGFPEAEFRARLARAQARMSDANLAALLLTTEPHIRYFTGFLTRFWESPTRPWFLVVPASGDPISVIPSIGAHLMGQTWISDIRTWDAPDYEDDGVSLLAEALAEITSSGDRIGTPSGMESHLRMPLADWQRLTSALPDRIFSDDAHIVRSIRLVKSAAEIDRIGTACTIAARAFERVPEIARPGEPLEHVFRRFQMLCLDEGADWVAYLAGAAAPAGYGDVISPATPRPLEQGDVLMLDTGCVHDGYFCDYDRNFSIGPPATEIADAHARLIDVTHAAFDLAKPGATIAELHHALRIDGMGGRLGHGLGMQLTEWPSIIPEDRTILEPGMVLTLEPAIALGPGRLMVHEENIAITEAGAEWLSPPADPAIPVIQ